MNSQDLPKPSKWPSRPHFISTNFEITAQHYPAAALGCAQSSSAIITARSRILLLYVATAPSTATHHTRVLSSRIALHLSGYRLGFAVRRRDLEHSHSKLCVVYAHVIVVRRRQDIGTRRSVKMQNRSLSEQRIHSLRTFTHLDGRIGTASVNCKI